MEVSISYDPTIRAKIIAIWIIRSIRSNDLEVFSVVVINSIKSLEYCLLAFLKFHFQFPWP